MNRSHTPAPWTAVPIVIANESAYYINGCANTNSAEVRVAIVGPTRNTPVDGNAALITAAPIMLATLIALEKWFDTDQEILDAMPEAERADNARQLANIRVAISCALGFGEGGDA